MSEPRTLDLWINTLARHGARSAVIALEEKDAHHTSYEQLDDISRRFAAGLQQRGVDPRDVVALFAPNSSAWIAACLGVIRARTVPAPLDVQFDDDALVHVFTDCKPRCVLTDANGAARLAELQLDASTDIVLLDVDRDDEQSWQRLIVDRPSELPRAELDDPAVLFYTSGTTGPPKGVPLTHENIAAQVDVLLNADLMNDDDRVLLPLPLHHVYPFVVGLLTPLARGLSIVLPYSLTGPQMMRAFKETAITIVIGVPRLYRALYDGIKTTIESHGGVSKFGTRSALAVSRWVRRRFGIRVGKWLLWPLHRRFGPNLRVAASGGSPLDDELAWNLESLGWQVAIGYGLTETSPLLTLNPPGRIRIGTVGKVIPHVELRIDDGDRDVGGDVAGQSIGEIVVRGPSVFGGYLNLPEKTEEVLTNEDWFHTGDLGYLDEFGDLHVTGRKGTMIVTEGGENVHPDDVESAYSDNSAIREIGVLDDNGRLVALIVPEVSQIDDDDVEESVARAVKTQGSELRAYRQIADFHLTRQSLPRTRLGKIQRHKLRERFEQAGERNQDVAQEPVTIEEMSSDDRVLLDDSAAKETWELLAEKYAYHPLTPNSSMRLDLGTDSLEWMSLSLDIRRQTGVEIDEEAIGRIETVRDLLREASEATEAGERSDMSPLDDPESALSDSQRRYLQPHGRLLSLVSRSVFAVNRLVMRCLFRLEVQGLDHLPDGPIVIAPNHVSYLDPPAVAAALPWQRLRHTYWGAWTGRLFNNFVMRWFSRVTHVVPVDPQHGAMSSLAFGAAVLKQDHNLVWFPEGARSTDGQLQPFRSGIGLLLKSRSARVIPTAIRGAYESLPPGRWLPRPQKIRVAFGETMNVDALFEDFESGDEAESHEHIASELQNAVAALLNTAQTSNSQKEHEDR